MARIYMRGDALVFEGFDLSPEFIGSKYLRVHDNVRAIFEHCIVSCGVARYDDEGNLEIVLGAHDGSKPEDEEEKSAIVLAIEEELPRVEREGRTIPNIKAGDLKGLPRGITLDDLTLRRAKGKA